MVTGPKGAFTPIAFRLEASTSLYRIHSNQSGRAANVFNPGIGQRTRFGFFDTPTVPILYAAETQEGAVCETVLHDVPVEGGMITADEYEDLVMSRLILNRDVSLVSFMDTGLRALKVQAEDITATTAARYNDTVGWAWAAHQAGYGGAVWMSHRCNTDRAFVFFGDRVSPEELSIDTGFARAFALEPDRSWLTAFCAPLHIEVRW